ncbi:MAG: TetR/AcrR family transcriptional regulator [Proteobacteria bacterium]|nr:TetR/AcrR family transcriptional regulator [Pseudomonadota bacterium]
MSDPQLFPRAAPKQARSRATFDHILKVSAALLQEVGLEGFNTNLLAERAGVSQRAIYRYFPNKFAVMLALSEQQSALEREWIGDLKTLDRFDDWNGAVSAAVDGYYRAARHWTGYTALRIASQAVPQLREFNAAAIERLEADLETGLKSLGVNLPAVRLRVTAKIIIETANRILDLAIETGGEEGDVMVQELKRMIVILVSEHLQGAGR